MKTTFFAVLAAAFAFTGSKSEAVSVNVSNGVAQTISYSGLLPTGASIQSFDYLADGTLRAGSPALYSDKGFVWQNRGGYGGDCQQGQGGGAAVFLSYGDNLYDHVNCGGGNFVRSDGKTFSVSSAKVDGQNFTLKAPTTPSPAAGLSGIDFSSGTAAELALLDSYQTWMDGSSNVYVPDQFYIAGYLGGKETVRQSFGATGGMTSLSLSGFTNIDELRFGYNTGPAYWDHYWADALYVEVLHPGQHWCLNACNTLSVFGFDLSVPSSLGTKPVAPVPVPLGGTLLLAALGLLRITTRQKGK